MDIINDTPLGFGCIPGRIPFPGHSLTLIVKGTFDISNSKVEISEEQLFPTGDEFYEDDEEMLGGPRYGSDFAYFKPKADLSLVGHCKAPHGTMASARQVTFGVGNIRQSLVVYGDRHWKSGITGVLASDPVPFERIPLRYENSYGGKGYLKNPVGKGYTKSTDDAGDSTRYLPNIMRHGEQFTTPFSKLEPAGFGTIGREWQQRKDKIGTYKKEYLKTMWPWFAKDFDYGYFNAAPTELQTGYLNGDESLLLENLIEDQESFQSKLPGIRIRCFINKISESGEGRELFSEVSMNLDTLWIDADEKKLVLVWRGWANVLSEEFEEINHIFIVSEPLVEEKPQTVPFYEDLLHRRLKEEEENWEEAEPEEAKPPVDDSDTDKLIAEAEASTRANLIKAGIDPDNLPEPGKADKEKEKQVLKELGYDEWIEKTPQITRKTVMDTADIDKNLSTAFMGDLDLSELDLSEFNFKGAILTGANLSGCNLTNANFEEAVLSGADLSRACLKNSNLENADFTGSKIQGTDFTKANLKNAIFDNCKMEKSRFDEADASDASFMEANLSFAGFNQSILKGADLSYSTLDSATFIKAKMAEASLEGTQAKGVVLDHADITELRASESADFSDSSFIQVSGKESIWEEANLTGANFSFAKLEGANFTKATLDGSCLRASELKTARFLRASLNNADLIQVNCLEGSFEKADLSNADMRGANLYGAEFLDAKIKNTKFEKANLKMTKLADHG